MDLMAHRVTIGVAFDGAVTKACACGWSAQAPDMTAAVDLEEQHLRRMHAGRDQAEDRLLEEMSGDQRTRLQD